MFKAKANFETNFVILLQILFQFQIQYKFSSRVYFWCTWWCCYACVRVSEHNSAQDMLSIELPFVDYVMDHCHKNCIFVQIDQWIWYLNNFVIPPPPPQTLLFNYFYCTDSFYSSITATFYWKVRASFINQIKT